MGIEHRIKNMKTEIILKKGEVKIWEGEIDGVVDHETSFRYEDKYYHIMFSIYSIEQKKITYLVRE